VTESVTLILEQEDKRCSFAVVINETGSIAPYELALALVTITVKLIPRFRYLPAGTISAATRRDTGHGRGY
jgi:hypothetical protein